MFFCSMCPFTSVNLERCNRHIVRYVRYHRNDPNWRVNCCIDECQYVSRSWNAYKMHVSRMHRHLDVEDNLHEDNVELFNVEDEEADMDEARQEHEITFDQQFIDAKFVLALKVDHHISDRGIESVVGNTTELISNHLIAYRKKVKNALLVNGQNTDFLYDIPLGGNNLETFTKHTHLKFLEEKCGLVRSVPILLGEKICDIRGNVRVVKKFGYIVPFQTNLKKLLSMPEVWKWLTHSHRSTDGIMRDVCDGSFMQNVFNQSGVHGIYIEVILYMDEIEIVNPIGSHVKKHKVNMIYFTLANIPPEFRSKFEAIQLLAVVKSVDVRAFGLESIMKDFIQSINLLQHEGIEMSLHDCNVVVKGSLIIAPADTPAAQFLGGFKEGVGFASKLCRTCNASRIEIKRKFIDREFRRRDPAEHVERLGLMSEMSTNARRYWSKSWGINSKSVLLDINNIDLAECLIHDPMHILSEGLLSKELCLMLHDFVKVRKYFKLSFLNESLASFTFSYLEEKNKPQIITMDELLNGRLKQTAATMMNLCSILPLVLGGKVPEGDGKWKKFLRLVQITLLVTSPYASADTAANLEQLIYTHHQEFKLEYPKSQITPKFHYLIHIPKQILKFGPGRNQWVMRFEGKHLFFKNIKWKCFKNIALSLSMRHQLWMCWRQLGVNENLSENFLYSGDIVSKIEASFIDQTDIEVHDFLVNSSLHLSPLFTAKQFEIKGHTYKIGCVLVLGYEDDLPKFGVVDQLFVVAQEKIFVVDQLDIDYFDCHTIYYAVERSNKLTCLKYTDLKFVWPLSMHAYNGYTVVLDKYCIFSEPL